jgi:hypothetical protein
MFPPILVASGVYIHKENWAKINKNTLHNAFIKKKKAANWALRDVSAAIRHAAFQACTAKLGCL